MGLTTEDGMSFYIKKDDDDKIAPRAMVLLGIFMVLMILSVFETIFGLF